jgi:hypothetical protein
MELPPVVDGKPAVGAELDQQPERVRVFHLEPDSVQVDHRRSLRVDHRRLFLSRLLLFGAATGCHE